MPDVGQVTDTVKLKGTGNQREVGQMTDTPGNQQEIGHMTDAPVKTAGNQREIGQMTDPPVKTTGNQREKDGCRTCARYTTSESDRGGE